MHKILEPATGQARFCRTYKALSAYFINPGIARFPVPPKLHVPCQHHEKRGRRHQGGALTIYKHQHKDNAVDTQNERS